MNTQFTTLIFVLFTIISAGCLRINNSDNHSQTFLAQTFTPPTATQANINIMGTGAQYAILAGSTVTNNGASTVTGSIGVNPGTEIAGTPINQIEGEIHAGDAPGLVAQNNIITAYNNLMNHIGSIDYTGKELGGITLGPGVYKFNSSCAITSGTLTLDGQGNPLAQWIFQIGSTITTGLKTNVNMINMGSPFNVYWQVGSSATISGTTMCGNIIAYASITLNSSVDLKGRALARGGAVTLIEDNIAMK